jgi:hypothetical protein
LVDTVVDEITAQVLVAAAHEVQLDCEGVLEYLDLFQAVVCGFCVLGRQGSELRDFLFFKVNPKFPQK